MTRFFLKKIKTFCVSALISGIFLEYHVKFLLSQQKFWLQLLERALEAAGNDLDSAIKSLTDLHLEPEETNLASIAGTCEDGTPVNHLANEGICTFPFLGLFLYFTVT